MRSLGWIWRREMGWFVRTPAGFGIGVLFLILTGSSFWYMVGQAGMGLLGSASLRPYLEANPLQWVVMLLTVPALTMNLIAGEKESGTIDHLLAAPVGAGQVVAGKFLAALTAYLLLWSLTGLHLVLLARHSSWDPSADLGLVAGLGTLLVLSGLFYLAIGTLCSSLTSSPVLAAVMTMGGMCLVFFLPFLAELTDSRTAQSVAAHISPRHHAAALLGGRLSLAVVAYYLSGAWLMLFAAARALEARMWRA